MKKVYCCPEAEFLRFRGEEKLATDWEYGKVTSFNAYRSGELSPSEADVALPSYPDGEY